VRQNHQSIVFGNVEIDPPEAVGLIISSAHSPFAAFRFSIRSHISVAIAYPFSS